MERIRTFWGWLAKPGNFGVVLLALVPFFILNGFMEAQARNIPRFDQYRAIPVALAVADGSLTLGDLLRPTHGHITAFTFGLTALNVYLTDWNLRAESYVNVAVATLNLGLYLVLFWRSGHRWTLFVLVPFSLMVFSVQQDFNWITPYGSGWHISIFWYLAAMTVLVYYPARWWALGAAAACCVLATFSHGNGFIAWGAVLVHLLLAERDRWRRVAVWLLVAIPTTALFLLVALPTAGDGAEAPVEVTAPLLARAWNFAVFTVGFIGSVFSSVYSGYGYAVAVGGLGLALLAVNAAYLMRSLPDRDHLRAWLPTAAYALAVGLMVAVTRLEQHEPERIFLTWYTTPAMLFWLALAALMAPVIGRLGTATTRRRWEGVLLYLNLMAAVFFAGRYVVANYNDLRHPYAADQVHLQREDCYARFIFRQTTDFDPTCIFPFYTDELNQLAARRLSVYAARPPESILTDDADPSLPVLVEAANPWINVHVRDYFLDGVDTGRLHNVYTLPEDAPDVLATMPNPPENGYRTGDAAASGELLAALSDEPSFWYIAREDHQTQMSGFWDELAAAGYAQVDVVARNEGLIVSRYVAVPPALAATPRFGDNIRLRAVTSVDAALRACETLTLETFWETSGALPLEYSANLVLIDETGNGAASSDARLSTVGTDDWTPGAVYYDTRTLQVPCETPPGEYELMFGIYYYQAPNDKLPVEHAASSRADLALIRMVTVLEPGE